MPRRLIVTGSSGLIGSEAVRHLCAHGYEVHGFDNNLRMDFFGPGGDTRWNRARLAAECPGFVAHDLDVRDRAAVFAAVQAIAPAAVIHCAAQPSHDLAGRRPLDDFDVNALGTANLLEAARQYAREAPFLLTSTNKVYGDAPNELPLRELPTRFEYARPEDRHGVAETMRIDRCTHTLMGASKLAADVLAQEYGRYYGMPVGVFRLGCVTGAAHSAVELHGFLSYLAKCVVSGTRYSVYGHQGKQVRDNIHARDVVAAMAEFLAAPRAGEVYNLGGGRENALSVREAIAAFEARAGRTLDHAFVATPRAGDHVCYISDVRKFCSHYPGFRPAWNLDRILDELIEHELSRGARR